MPEDAFEKLGHILESGDPQSCFDFVIAECRGTRNYRLLFETRLMAKRLELGMPLIQRPDLSALPNHVQEAYGQAITETAREVGGLFLADGEIANAWPYLRATGDSDRAAAAIEGVQPGDDLDTIIEIALQEGVHPAKGLELLLARYGICRALTAFGMLNIEKDRERCVALLARNVHGELVERLGAAIESVEESRPDSTSVTTLIANREWLFGEYSTYIDTSHVVTLLQYAPEVRDAAVLRLLHELCEYGKCLSLQFQSRGQPPFENIFVDYGHYVQALLGWNVETHIAHFRAKVAGTAPEEGGFVAATVLVNLLVRLELYAEALEVSLEYLPEMPSAQAPCPSAAELCYLAKDFNRLKKLAVEHSDLLSYAAAGLALSVKSSSSA